MEATFYLIGSIYFALAAVEIICKGTLWVYYHAQEEKVDDAINQIWK